MKKLDDYHPLRTNPLRQNQQANLYPYRDSGQLMTAFIKILFASTETLLCL